MLLLLDTYANVPYPPVKGRHGSAGAMDTHPLNLRSDHGPHMTKRSPEHAAVPA